MASHGHCHWNFYAFDGHLKCSSMGEKKNPERERRHKTFVLTITWFPILIHCLARREEGMGGLVFVGLVNHTTPLAAHFADIQSNQIESFGCCPSGWFGPLMTSFLCASLSEVIKSNMRALRQEKENLKRQVATEAANPAINAATWRNMSEFVAWDSSGFGQCANNSQLVKFFGGANLCACCAAASRATYKNCCSLLVHFWSSQKNTKNCGSTFCSRHINYLNYLRMCAATEDVWQFLLIFLFLTCEKEIEKPAASPAAAPRGMTWHSGLRARKFVAYSFNWCPSFLLS